jgi:uncharacterized protein
MAYVPIALGDAGVLAPGRWRWARALGWLVLLGAVAILTSLLLPGLKSALHLSGWPVRVVATAQLLATFAAYALLVRFGERRSVQELAPRAAGDLLVGLAIGAGLFTLVFAAIRLGGGYTLAPGRWTDWDGDLFQMTHVGFFEELLARAIIFRLLMRAAGVWPAIVVSSLLFGAGHLGNPNATVLSAAAIAVEAGTLLAGFYLLTGRLWMSIGAHIAWNVAQGPVFGASVSGHPEVGSVFASAPVAGAPAWLTGGAFGPEASVPAMLACLVAFALTWRGARRRGFV